MKCKVCGAESGNYPLCRVCNIKKEKGDIVKCSLCGEWHEIDVPCSESRSARTFDSNGYVYNAKSVLISNSEKAYFDVIISSLPKGYYAFPQVNLASFIEKNDSSPYHNELFRNVDFLITNERYNPLFVIEINDRTHLNQDRKERDEKVQKICEEAGIPIIRFWTSYGVNSEYISKKINECIISLPVERVHHFTRNDKSEKSQPIENIPIHSIPQYSNYSNRRRRKQGCYVATCVYRTYDCPEVWTLRRFRDERLSKTVYGRAFIRVYYFISPIVVKIFGKFKWFHRIVKSSLDKFVLSLNGKGFENTPYNDKDWN